MGKKGEISLLRPNPNLPVRFRRHHFFVHFLAFVGERVETDLQLRHQVDEGVDPSFRLKKLVEHDHFLSLQNAIAALKIASFITDHVTCFLRYPLNFI